ncbi:DUF1593-domain-containing protein [Dactylonectria macrodidyma]|uniref:DUF1593-domain-containing protein n=1 Tax=Dactylonectria macrodidyma TaxID=307937 RepID=A0A9P9EP80_9HYPO|nr:DUF1593-domain-containing protein [Dactylonectria macrodidyma]
MRGHLLPFRLLAVCSGLPFFTQQPTVHALKTGLCDQARYENKPRVFIATDISNEPDDQMSLVRLLSHSNELDIVNVAGTTSVWKNTSIDLPSIFGVINGYGEATSNLNKNVPPAVQYPSAHKLLSSVVSGHPVYGRAVFDEPKLSNASIALIKAVDASLEPLWFLAWGGTNILAEALNEVRGKRRRRDVDEFVSKLRVYAISDQDNSGPWIRVHFPHLFYIVSIHGFSEYAMPTWLGISGELYRPFDLGGPNSSLITNEWLQDHIRIGPLGAHYLNWSVIMEGDTPSFLGLLPNGLNDPEHPEWGGWGGRYMPIDTSGLISTYSDATDMAIGLNNGTFASRWASIWRWRPAFQYDFATRIQWSIRSDPSKANHHPIAVINGTCGFKAWEVPYKNNTPIVLDASQSWDPDDDTLSFSWFHYREPNIRIGKNFPRVSQFATFTPLNSQGSKVSVTVNNNLTAHIILTIDDGGSQPLSAYRRIILQPTA